MPQPEQLTPDAKGEASLTLHDVVTNSSDFYLDKWTRVYPFRVKDLGVELASRGDLVGHR